MPMLELGLPKHADAFPPTVYDSARLLFRRDFCCWFFFAVMFVVVGSLSAAVWLLRVFFTVLLFVLVLQFFCRWF